jgi:hypothetical protein
MLPTPRFHLMLDEAHASLENSSRAFLGPDDAHPQPMYDSRSY